MILMLERIRKEDIAKWNKEALMFAKDIRRIDNGKDLQRVHVAFKRWLGNFLDFLDNMTGKGTTSYDVTQFDNIIVVREFNKQIDTFFDTMEKMFQGKTISKGPFLPEYNESRELDVWLSDEEASKFNKGKPMTDQQYTLIYSLWNEVRDKKYQRFTKQVRDFFADIEELYGALFRSRGDSNDPTESIPETQKVDYTKIGGITVKNVYHEGEGLGWIRRVYDIIKTSAEAVKKAGFGKVLNRVGIEINRQSTYGVKEIKDANGKNWGSYAGVYRGNTEFEIMIIDPGATVKSNNVEDILVHEIGHKWYYEIMTEAQRKEWIAFVDSVTKKGEGLSFRDGIVKLYDVLDGYKEEWRKVRNEYEGDRAVDLRSRFPYFVEPFSFVNHYADKNLNEFLQQKWDSVMTEWKHKLKKDKDIMLSNMVMSPGGVSFLISAIETIASISDYSAIKKDEVMYAPTKYATFNPQEYFAETFMYYVLGPKKRSQWLEEIVFKAFIDITGVRR